MNLLKVSQPQGNFCVGGNGAYVQVDGCSDPDAIVYQITLNAGVPIADPEVIRPNIFVTNLGDGLHRIEADKSGAYLIEFFCGDCFDPPPPPLNRIP